VEKVTVYIAPYVHCPFSDARKAEGPLAYRLLKNGEIEETPVKSLKVRDKVVIDSGRIIPGCGEIIEGCATVDESASTGHSTPVIREAGGDRSEVIGGTRVVRGHIVVLLKKVPAQS
jgi:K+-transporting ATPase ATPase B chain